MSDDEVWAPPRRDPLEQQRLDIAGVWADPQGQVFAAILLDIADSLRCICDRMPSGCPR